MSTNHTSAPHFPQAHAHAPAPGSTPDKASPALCLPDLRRRDARLHTEQIIRRACFLPREQRTLIAAIYQQGHSYADLAALSGQRIRPLRREVRRILHRLASPEFAYVVLHLDEWQATMRRVAECCVLAGEPVRSAAQTLRLSLHTVRKYRNLVRLLAAQAGNNLDGHSRSRAG